MSDSDPTLTAAAGSSHAPLGDVGPLVLGGNVFGWTADREASFAVLDAFVEAGGRQIDTADVYSAWVDGHSGGESETIIGEWLATSGHRDAVQIATKVSKHPGRPGLARDNVRAAIEESLTRLQTDVIDLYYAHADDESQSPEQIAATFDELVTEGKVRAIGLSNFSPERLRAVVEAARSENLVPAAYAQDRWSLVERSIEGALVPVLADLGVMQLPYSALASGFLTGKYRDGVDVDSPRAGGAGAYLERPGAAGLLEALDGVARAHDVAPASVALAWLRTRPTVGAPIASARSTDQLPALVASFTLDLSPEQIRELDDASDALG
ncbi:aldo/keto reductase [Litorihabitans aurantiacus]|uniref:Oxidoreductase n=1 Tax=Litorihabitans aurantiacus TaxID=1930061 RepID=A0AA37UP30_9MICO|nr:aldo/keto reductase [Litorihabitans aurantiacus]GMA30446.1 oxidoreductase [Litorihabitans aurantiacus]